MEGLLSCNAIFCAAAVATALGALSRAAAQSSHPEDLIDARSPLLTASTTSVYGFACINLSKGPVVLPVPGVVGPVEEACFLWMTDIRLTGPDCGKGGIVPPAYSGDLPSEGYSPRRGSTPLPLFSAPW